MMVIINVDSTLDFAIQLPCKKVMLFTRVDKDRVRAEVYQNRDQFDLVSRGLRVPESLQVEPVKIKYKTFWLQEELAYSRKEIKRLRNLVLQHAFSAACEWYYDPADGFDKWCQEYGTAALSHQAVNVS